MSTVVYDDVLCAHTQVILDVSNHF